MPAVEDSLRKILIDNVSISAIVGTRVYPMRTPEKPTFPVITYERMSTDYDTTLTTAQGFASIYFEINVFCNKLTSSGASGFEQARSLARLIADALCGFTGTILSVDLQGIFLENEDHGYEADIEAYRVSQDFRIVCNE